MIELFMSLSLVTEGAHASKPPQASLPENYPQITRSSICSITIAEDENSNEVSFMNYIFSKFQFLLLSNINFLNNTDCIRRIKMFLNISNMNFNNLI